MGDRNIRLILHLLYDAVCISDLSQVLDLFLDSAVLSRSISQKDWTDICSLYICKKCSVSFFLLKGLLVLLNQVVLIVCHRAGRD